jgi:hypothetical protein
MPQLPTMPIPQSKSLHIPHFGAKFDFLFRRHPSIKNGRDLCGELGLAASNFTQWKNGSQFSRAEHIPIRHCGRVCELLHVDEEVLLMPAFEDFYQAVGRPMVDKGLWQDLVVHARDTGALHVLRAEDVKARPGQLAQSRGIYIPEQNHDDLPVLRIDEQFIIRLDARPHWHAVLLTHDRTGWHVLMPMAKEMNTSLNTPMFCPRQHDFDDPLFAVVTEPLGTQCLLAVLRCAPWPPELLEAIAAEHKLPETLESLAALIAGPDGTDSEIVEFRFFVEPKEQR